MTRTAGNAADMKKSNGAALIRSLFNKPLSRADLARELGLTKASISDHIDEFISSGLVRELGTGQSERGRKPVLLDINPDYGFFAGVYLNVGISRMGLLNMKGQVIARRSLDSVANCAPEKMVAMISDEVTNLIGEQGLDREKMLSAGVGFPGLVDSAEGTVQAMEEIPEWGMFPLAARLSEKLGRPVYLENGAVCLVLAELRFGRGREYDSFILITADDSIRGGIILGNQRLAGSAYGSELGHTSIRIDGRQCYCGNRGCLEQYASIPALIRDCFPNGDGVLSWRDIVDNAEGGDKYSQNVISQEAGYLSVTLINLINVLAPQAVVIGGDLAYQPERLTGFLESKINSSIKARSQKKVEVLHSLLEDASGVLAAGTVAMETFDYP